MASDAFLQAGSAMSQRLGLYWPNLLRVMNTESGIDPSRMNPGGAAGLIQIEDLAGVGWNGTRQGFLALSDVAQLPYVERFLRPYAGFNLNSAGRIHQALVAPATLGEGGQDPNFVVYRKNGTRWQGREAGYYEGNKLFDATNKGYFTVGDMEAYDVAHSASPSSPYQRAIARLYVLIPQYAQQASAMASTTAKKTGAWILGSLALGAGIWYSYNNVPAVRRIIRRI